MTSEPISMVQASEFRHNLPVLLLATQLGLVALFAPAYAVSALAEEKDRQTLPLLLTTDLTEQEIVWTKGLGRVLLIFQAILATLPVMIVAICLGDVDVSFLVTGYGLIFGTTVLCIAVGIRTATYAPDSRTALFRAYTLTAALVGGLVIPPLILLSPFALLIYVVPASPGLSEPMRVAGILLYAAIQVAIAVAFLMSAGRNLRLTGASSGPLDRTAYPEPPRGRATPILLEVATRGPSPRTPLADHHPVLWNERHAGRLRPPLAIDAPIHWLGSLLGLIAIGLFIAGSGLVVQRALRALDPVEADRLAQRGPEPPDMGGALLTMGGVLAAGLYLLPLAAGISGCVAGERQRGTLDAILSTPLPRWSILGAKVRSHIERGLVFGVAALTGIACGFGVDGGTRLGLAAMLAVATGFTLVIALTSWLSVHVLVPGQAFRLSLAAVAIVVGLPILTRSAIDWRAKDSAMTFFLCYAAICAAAAIGLWWRAILDLERGM